MLPIRGLLEPDVLSLELVRVKLGDLLGTGSSTLSAIVLVTSDSSFQISFVVKLAKLSVYVRAYTSRWAWPRDELYTMGNSRPSDHKKWTNPLRFQRNLVHSYLIRSY